MVIGFRTCSQLLELMIPHFFFFVSLNVKRLNETPATLFPSLRKHDDYKMHLGWGFSLLQSAP
jgi:hypothetical protein